MMIRSSHAAKTYALIAGLLFILCSAYYNFRDMYRDNIGYFIICGIVGIIAGVTFIFAAKDELSAKTCFETGIFQLVHTAVYVYGLLVVNDLPGIINLKNETSFTRIRIAYDELIKLILKLMLPDILSFAVLGTIIILSFSGKPSKTASKMWFIPALIWGIGFIPYLKVIDAFEEIADGEIVFPLIYIIKTGAFIFAGLWINNLSLSISQTGSDIYRTAGVPVGTAVCANCGKPLPADAAFCQNCGKAADSSSYEENAAGFCSQCGGRITPDMDFCTKCGNRLK